MANPHEAFGKNVLQKPTDKLTGVQGGDLSGVSVGVVFPGESNLSVLHINQPLIRNGNAMRVSSQILQNALRASKGALGPYDPLALDRQIEKPLELSWRGQGCQVAVKREFAFSEGLFQETDELAAKNAAERLHRCKKDLFTLLGDLTGNPTRPVRRDTASGYHAVQGWVMV